MDTDGAIQCISLVLLLFLSAFFSASETALTTVHRIKLESLADGGNKKAVTVLKLLGKPSKMLSTILIANNVVNISASALATTLAIRIWGNSYVALATGVLTLLILIFGEITPKTMATIKSEKMALSVGGIIYFISKVLTPIIYIVDALANGILKMFRVDPAEARSAMTEYEFRTIVEASHEDGVIESEERQMIYNVVDLGDSLAKDIMIPRIEMTCVNVEATYDELKEVFDKEKFLEDIREVFKRKRCVVIAVSEGIKDKDGHFLDDDSKYAKKDAFGHVLHSGTGKMLESLVFKEFQCKVRSIELNVLQRCAMHIGSKTDLNESFVVGQKAIETALTGKSGQVMGFKRISNTPYEIDYISTDVRKVANLEQKIPTAWINEAGNDITQELYDYLYPLIQGEVHINYLNGIPAYYSCKHLNK